MPEELLNTPKKYMAYFKDAVYIIGIVISLVGWVITQSKSKAILETTVNQNNIAIEKIQESLNEQAVLNGKIIQYIEMDMASK